MELSTEKILEKECFSKEDIIFLLKTEGEHKKNLFKKSQEIKQRYLSNKVHLRGLIEYSNICNKNCLYCGIRKDNQNVKRYSLSKKEAIEAVNFALKNNYGSIVIQGGENNSKKYIEAIDQLIKDIKYFSENKIGITLSLGEQKEETYQQWFDSGAHRYLLRIETSNMLLFSKIHPYDSNHDFSKRLAALECLKEIGYQVGTGVMIGLPFQTIEDLADDIIFMHDFDIPMCGMGPYIEHSETPLQKYSHLLFTKEQRFDLTLKMIAILRILMKDINIASTTALQTIDVIGREKAINVGANILMPNITPGKYRREYQLYENKSCINEEAEECKNCLDARIKFTGNEIAYSEWGDSKHFKKIPKLKWWMI